MEKYKTMTKGAKIIKKYMDNGIMDARQIAQKSGYSIATVSNYLSLYFPTERVRNCEFNGKRISVLTKAIIDRLNEGQEQSKIALLVGVSRQRVSFVNKKYIKRSKL